MGLLFENLLRALTEPGSPRLSKDTTHPSFTPYRASKSTYSEYSFSSNARFCWGSVFSSSWRSADHFTISNSSQNGTEALHENASVVHDRIGPGREQRGGLL